MGQAAICREPEKLVRDGYEDRGLTTNPPTKNAPLSGAFSHSEGGVCTHIPDAPNHLCGRVYQTSEVRKLP